MAGGCIVHCSYVVHNIRLYKMCMFRLGKIGRKPASELGSMKNKSESQLISSNCRRSSTGNSSSNSSSRSTVWAVW